MRVEEVKETVFPVLEAIEGVKEVYVNDFNRDSMTFCIEIEDDVLKKNLRTLSTNLRNKLKKLGISKEHGNLLGWEAPVKRKDFFNGLVCDTNYFLVDFCYAYAILNLQREFLEEYHIFDKYNILNKNDSKLEDMFRKSHSKFNCVEDHIEYLENRFEFAGVYNIYPIYKYEHSTIVYEESPSCRWDSGLVGVVAIEKSSKMNVSDIIEMINFELQYAY